MEFLGIGPLELFFIVLIALIILGPQDMIKAGRTMGRLMRRTILSPSWLNIQRKVRNLPYELMREAGLEDEEVRAGINDLRKMTKVDLAKDLARSLEPGSTEPRPTEPNFGPEPQEILPYSEDSPEIPTPEEPLQSGNGSQVRTYPAQEEPASQPVTGETSSEVSPSAQPGSDPDQP